jgi:hypothetical protein
LDTRQFTVRTPQKPPHSLTVKVEEEGKEPRELHFDRPFVVGRDARCDVVINDRQVSKKHVEVYFEREGWWARDLNSTNGTYRDGQKITSGRVEGKTRLTLGPLGPYLTLIVSGGAALEETQPITDQTVVDYAEKLIHTPSTAKIGERTRMLQRALLVVQKKQSRKYLWIIGVVSLAGLVAAGIAYVKHQELLKQQELAKAVFYELKQLELDQAALERKLATVADPALQSEAAAARARRKELAERYDKFVQELGFYGGSLSDKEQIIYRVARVFGECEITMPPEVIDEVERYIDLWKRSPKLVRAVQRAEELGYAKSVEAMMMEYDMPPQFFYLALKESDFDSTICGPPTRFGIAKGVWQFIPTTAREYGLRTGPLVDFPRHDPRDERHNVEKSTRAAARYLRDIYSTEAQASGLLVIAGYNWGHNNVRGLIRKLPENPRERNFWTFLVTYRDKLPKETYDYVFYIFAAAVIGENPQLFGFSFPKPL